MSICVRSAFMAAMVVVSTVASAQTDSIAELLGQLNPTTDARFVSVPAQYASKTGMYLRQDALAAFVRMADAAQKDGVSLKVISATRTFNHQKRIWEAKWTGATKVRGRDLSQMTDETARSRTILTYSSMPGTSRHHWGTDVDINSLSPSYFVSGKGLEELNWLMAHAEQFGFCRPYQGKGTLRTSGYEDEAWHWSYMPISGQLLNSYLRLVKYDRIAGFKGSAQAQKIGVIDGYVKAIVGCD